jgi:hypothetical protein
MNSSGGGPYAAAAGDSAVSAFMLDSACARDRGAFASRSDGGGGGGYNETEGLPSYHEAGVSYADKAVHSPGVNNKSPVVYRQQAEGLANLPMQGKLGLTIDMMSTGTRYSIYTAPHHPFSLCADCVTFELAVSAAFLGKNCG